MAQKQKREENENLAEELEDLDRKLSRLRVLYEQYFIGVEKRPPTMQHNDVNRMVQKISNYTIRKTSHKFRFQALMQRYNVHRAYWIRVCREIEEGRYKNHRRKVSNRSLATSGERLDNAELVKRAMLLKTHGQEAVDERRRRQQAEGGNVAESTAYVPAVARRRRRGKQVSSDLRGAPIAQVESVNARAAGESVKQSPASTPTSSTGWGQLEGGSRAAAGVLSGAGITETRARAIYDTLVTARRQQGESTDSLSFDRIVRSMAKQIPKVRANHGAESVDFNVVKKGSKVYLKPIPK